MPVTNNKKPSAKRKHAEDPPTAAPAPSPAKKRMVVTPWRDTTEFSTVYEWLFAKQTTPANCRKALSQMRIWNLRRGSLCPASVLATAVLVKAQLEDKQGSTNIQPTYASAFTRFFNFMSSIMQNYNMSSMYTTARQLGLQSFIVDLRHLCAHGQELPPTVVLRHTAAHCLEWLRNFYWLPQCESMSNLDAPKLQRKDKAKFQNELAILFEMFDLALECQLKGAQKLKSVSKLKPSAEFNKIRVYCSTRKLKTTREIMDTVVTELGAAVKRQTSSMKDLLDIYMAGILKMNYFLGAGLSHSEDEDLVIEATQGLFRLLAMQGYIENLFVAFVQLTENSNADDERRRGASYWATKMLQTFGMLSRMKRMYKEELDMNSKLKPVDFSTLNKPKISKTMRALLIHSGVDLTLTLVFGECPKKPRSWVFEREFLMNRLGPLNIHSAPVLKGLLPLVVPPLTEQLEDFSKQSNLKLQDINGEQKIITDNQSTDITKNGSHHKPEDTVFGIWSLEKDKNWSICALGVLPTTIN
ncbi:uncharacterized protein LOC115770136 isoform X1 [Drosophila novamexicana]|uniref:uncharacterized protein LOC115770136 isoform X1 n=2 Tax=Drosophila novamexicana TaxID=47314 RepID=UPI0011E59E0F|nr:uncharacterized protein LOC115770136 isoform X1 [Drosophila novamexicana]